MRTETRIFRKGWIIAIIVTMNHSLRKIMAIVWLQFGAIGMTIMECYDFTLEYIQKIGSLYNCL